MYFNSMTKKMKKLGLLNCIVSPRPRVKMSWINCYWRGHWPIDRVCIRVDTCISSCEHVRLQFSDPPHDHVCMLVAMCIRVDTCISPLVGTCRVTPQFSDQCHGQTRRRVINRKQLNTHSPVSSHHQQYLHLQSTCRCELAVISRYLELNTHISSNI